MKTLIVLALLYPVTLKCPGVKISRPSFVFENSSLLLKTYAGSKDTAFIFDQTELYFTLEKGLWTFTDLDGNYYKFYTKDWVLKFN